MLTFLRKRPWIWIVLVFVILIVSWIFLIRLANERGPKPLPDNYPNHHANAES